MPKHENKAAQGSKEENRRTQVLDVSDKVPVPVPGSAGGLLGKTLKALKKVNKKNK